MFRFHHPFATAACLSSVFLAVLFSWFLAHVNETPVTVTWQESASAPPLDWTHRELIHHLRERGFRAFSWPQPDTVWHRDCVWLTPRAGYDPRDPEVRQWITAVCVVRHPTVQSARQAVGIYGESASPDGEIGWSWGHFSFVGEPDYVQAIQDAINCPVDRPPAAPGRRQGQ